MSVEAMVSKALIAAADSLEKLNDIGMRIKVEVDGGYEWTRNAEELSDVRDEWKRAYKEIQIANTLT